MWIERPMHGSEIDWSPTIFAFSECFAVDVMRAHLANFRNVVAMLYALCLAHVRFGR